MTCIILPHRDEAAQFSDASDNDHGDILTDLQ